MERRKPLTARTQLGRGKGLVANTSLARGAGLKTRTGLKPRSDKMQLLYEARRPFVQQFLAAHPWCQVNWDKDCQLKSVDVHEKLARSGGGHIVGEDDGQFIAACRHCHMMIGENPKEAHARGFRSWSWEV